MNLLNKLTKKNLLLNKKRTIVTVIGIILSVSLIMALSSLVASFIGSATVYEKMRSGNFHVSFDNVKSSDVDKFKNNRYVEDVYFTKEIGYSMMKNIQNEDKPYVYVLAFDFKERRFKECSITLEYLIILISSNSHSHLQPHDIKSQVFLRVFTLEWSMKPMLLIQEGSLSLSPT